jgi:hypothetical protein
VSPRILELGPRGHAERLDGGDERTGGRLYVDDAGVVHWRAYGDEPSQPGMGPSTLLNGLQSPCEDVEPALGPQSPADEAARRQALREHDDARGRS